MNLLYGPDYEIFRGEVRAFLERAWIKPREAGCEVDEAAFRQLAVEAGLLYRSVPRAYGGSEQRQNPLYARIIVEEFAKAGAPGEIKGVGTQMLVPTLLECGAPWQMELFIPPTLRGEYRWCQGYSEPAAGSDLASLRTRAEMRDGRWIINGHKVWTSYAHRARFMFALVRTEPLKPRHQGFSYLLIDMKQPGIKVQPLRQIDGGEEFNEVFLTDATTPADWIVGERGAGWTVSKALLKHERNMLGGIDRSEALFTSLLGLARRVRWDGEVAIQNPYVRDRLAALKARLEVQRHSAHIQMTRACRGTPVGQLQLINKLLQSEFAADVARLANELLGDDALLSPIGNPRPGNERWSRQFMNSLAAGIAGGTSNIQRNIIAERGLGLPREPGSAAEAGA